MLSKSVYRGSIAFGALAASIRRLHNSGKMMTMSYVIDCHVCREGYIKPYPTVICSYCLPSESENKRMTRQEIDEFNRILRNLKTFREIISKD